MEHEKMSTESSIKGEERNVGSVEEVSMGEYKRVVSARSFQVISLGSNMGSGLFITLGRALNLAGPGAILFAYLYVSTLVFCVLQVLTEMTIVFPVSGNLFEYCDRWVDPALAFAAGFAEWLGWTAVVGSEATIFVTLINYWADGSVHQAVWLTVFTVFLLILFSLPSQWFAYFEYFSSLVKVVTFLILVFTCLAVTLGAGPSGRVHHGETWTDHPSFANGFSGVANALLLAIWACSDQIFIGIMGGEAQFPRFTMARAAKMVTTRIILVYLISLIFITLLVPMDDARLFGASDASSSPFVIAIQDAGIPGLPDLVNAVVALAALAMACESVYIASRVLRSLSVQGLVPPIFGKVDGQGRPRVSLLVTCVVGTVLTYINLSKGGVEVFTWFVSITSSSFFCVWITLLITAWGFRRAVDAQDDPIFRRRFAWRASAWPALMLWLGLGCALLLVSCIYAGLYPVGTRTASVEGFFQYMLGTIMILASYVGYKIVFRRPFRNPKTADLVTSRRELTEEEISALEHYFQQPLWRRFASYFKIW